MELRYGVWVETHEAILKPSSEAQNSFWIRLKVTPEKILDNPPVQLIKLSRVLPVVWRESTWTVMEVTKDIQKSVRTSGVCAVLN